MVKGDIEQPLPPEGQQLEYKLIVPPPRSLARLIASFANADGGKIIFGIKEEGPTVVGLPEGLAVWVFIQAAMSHLKPQPFINHYSEVIDGKDVYVLQIERHTSPILNEDSLQYIRKEARTELLRVQDDLHPHEDEGECVAKYSKIKHLIQKLETAKLGASESKLELIKHYTAVLCLIDRCSSILFPVSPSQPTNIQQGKILLRLMVTSLVDPLEKYLRDLMLEIYPANPNTLKSHAPAQATSKEVIEFMQAGDSMAFYKFEAERRVRQLLRGSIQGFVDKFKKEYKLEIFLDSEKVKAEEIFQIRHLYVHENGKVDNEFLKKCPGQSLTKGQEHQLSVDEFCEMVDFLLTIVNRLDKAAVSKYKLNTPTEEI